MSVAVCLALSLKLLHKFTEGSAVVTAFVVDLKTLFFPLPKGLVAFLLSLAFLPCPSRAPFVTWGLGFTLLLVTMTDHGNVTGAFVSCSYHSLQIFIPSPIGPFNVFLPI